MTAIKCSHGRSWKILRMVSCGSDWTRGRTVPDKGHPDPCSLFHLQSKSLDGLLHMEEQPKQQKQQQNPKNWCIRARGFCRSGKKMRRGIKKAPPLGKGQEYTPDPELQLEGERDIGESTTCRHDVIVLPREITQSIREGVLSQTTTFPANKHQLKNKSEIHLSQILSWEDGKRGTQSQVGSKH